MHFHCRLTADICSVVAALTLDSGVVSSSPAAVITLFCIFLYFWGAWGRLGFDFRPETAIRQQPTAAMRPLYSETVQKVTYTHDTGDQRKPAEIGQTFIFMHVSILQKVTKSIFFKIPRSNSKLKLQWSILMPLVPPVPPLYAQSVKSISTRF